MCFVAPTDPDVISPSEISVLDAILKGGHSLSLKVSSQYSTFTIVVCRLVLLLLLGPFYGAIAVPCHALSLLLLSMSLWTSMRSLQVVCDSGGVRQ